MTDTPRHNRRSTTAHKRQDDRRGRRDDRRGRGDDRRRGGSTHRRDGGRPKTSTSPRAAAFDVLMAVEESDSYANLLLPPMLRERRIFGRDAGFATELTYGTLRMQGRYDAIIDAASDRSSTEFDRPILIALRLGVHQLLATRVPPHAAVSETVALARDRISAGPAQLVNAVLRRVSEKTLEEWLDLLRTDKDDHNLAVRHSHPEWIVRAFNQALRAAPTADQEAPEDLEAALEANNVAPEVHLVVRPGMVGENDLEGSEVRAGTYARTTRYLSGGDPGAVPGIRAGRIGVQDEGSQLVTLAALEVPVEGADDTWLDLCAGPGGKAALMAAVLADRGGGTLIANELHEHRTRLVDHNLKAIPANVDARAQTGDGTVLGSMEAGKYDRVLIDAPCTGLGALRRRPESRWRRTASDLPGLTSVQRDLLQSGLEAVRVGGVVAYITCSPHVAETTLIVDDARRDVRKKGIETDVLDATGYIDTVSRTPVEHLNGPYVQLWPHLHGTDAMFLALIRRTA